VGPQEGKQEQAPKESSKEEKKAPSVWKKQTPQNALGKGAKGTANVSIAK